MDELIMQFIIQLKEALTIGLEVSLPDLPNEVHHILVCGMGGSGIGGDFVSSWTLEERRVPMEVAKDYHVPGYCNDHTLAIVSSYSGNTEETLAALHELQQAGAMIVAVTSGGLLAKEAKEHGHGLIEVPAGWSSPRACLGYSFVQQLTVLSYYGLISAQWEEDLTEAICLLENQQKAIREKASRIAALLETKQAVIYSSSVNEAAALRWRQQLNENAKTLCWHNCFPELNHNELVGWRGAYDHLAVIVLRTKQDFWRTQARIKISKEIMAQVAGSYIEIIAIGQSRIAQSLYFVHLGDWVSYELAQIRNMDPIEVKVIDYLKAQLQNITKS